MRQERWKRWWGSVGARLARRRSALPLLVVAIALASAAALVVRPPLQVGKRGQAGVDEGHRAATVSGSR